MDIGNCFVTNFKHLFTSTNPVFPSELLDLFNPVILDLDNTLLCSIPDKAEIYDSLLNLGREKAPGPDGFTALFYIKYWDCIKPTFCWLLEIFLIPINFFESRMILSLL
jgi:hypothetical protein